MDDVQRTIVAGQLFGLRSGRTVRQLGARYVGQALEIVVACVAKVRCAKAEEDGDRAAVAAFVLEEIGAVLGAHLGASDVRAAAADELLRVEAIAGLGVAARLAAVVGFRALEADVVGVALHRVGGGVALGGRAGGGAAAGGGECRGGGGFVVALVLEAGGGGGEERRV